MSERDKSLNKVPFVVDRVDFKEVKLIDEKGELHNKVSISDAKNRALETGLDLVCFKDEDHDKLALCKIINHGKWKYEQSKKLKKNTHKKAVKEIRFTPLIGENDIRYKVKKAIGHLEKGEDVVLAMRMKGRQLSHSKDAEETLDNIVSQCTNGKILKKNRSGNVFVVRLTKA